MAAKTAQELYNEVASRSRKAHEFAEVLALLNEGMEDIAGRCLLPELETWANLYVGTATLTATTLSFTASTSKIADSGSAFVTSGFHTGQAITISGAGEAGNNQSTTVTAVESDGSAITVAGTLTDEAAGESVTVANTGPNYVPMPSDYQRDIFRCYSVTHNRMKPIEGSVMLMLEHYTQIDLSGPVRYTAVRGSEFHYQRIPSTVEHLRIYYYKKPTAMTEADDTPTCIPESFVKPLLINYVFKELDPDNDKWDFRFEQAVGHLKEYLGPNANAVYLQPDDFRRAINWDALGRE